MKKNVKYILMLLLFAAAIISSGRSQELKIIRTDVDSARSGFVTATYIFGFDVKIDSIKNCTALTFEMQFNKTKYIAFSEARAAQFNGKGKYYVIPEIDYTNDIGKISVAASSGDAIDEAGLDNPRVIHFEFAVSQTAKPNESVNISFLNIYAVVFQDSIRKILPLKSKSYVMQIHSFINVWPGDADNNGVVNNLDFAVVASNFLTDSTAKASRRFKRVTPSTIWTPQRVLAWDNHDATYADCDGNGVITTTDMLVVSMNYDSVHSSAGKSKDKPLGLFIQQEIEKNDKSIAIPVKVKSAQSLIGVAAEIDLSPLTRDFDIIGIEAGDLFAGDKLLYFSNIDMQSETGDIVFSTPERGLAASAGIICNIIVEPKNNGYSIPANLTINATGLSPLNYLFSIDAATDIVDYSPSGEYSIYFSETSDNIAIKLPLERSGKYSVQIFDAGGNLVISGIIESGNEIAGFDARSLRSGAYFALISNGLESRRSSLLIAR